MWIYYFSNWSSINFSRTISDTKVEQKPILFSPSCWAYLCTLLTKLFSSDIDLGFWMMFTFVKKLEAVCDLKLLFSFESFSWSFNSRNDTFDDLVWSYSTSQIGLFVVSRFCICFLLKPGVADSLIFYYCWP